MTSRRNLPGGEPDDLSVFSYFSPVGDIFQGQLVPQWNLLGRLYFSISRRDLLAGVNVPAGNGDVVFGPKNNRGWGR